MAAPGWKLTANVTPTCPPQRSLRSTVAKECSWLATLQTCNDYNAALGASGDSGCDHATPQCPPTRSHCSSASTASSSTAQLVQCLGVPLSLAHCGRSLGVMRRCLSPFSRCVFALRCCITAPDCAATRPGHVVQDAKGTVRVILTKRAAHLSSHKGAPSSRW